jgi:dTDP-4-dehydrorhamnose 3,5-epimerase-like enzyme
MTNKSSTELWAGLNQSARDALVSRDYSDASLPERIAGVGVAAAELVPVRREDKDIQQIWIPGVEIFQRKVHPQRHRGFFGEFARKDEGVLAKIGLWPKQWATARMFAQTAKGFHVHPPTVPEGTSAAEWHRRLFEHEPQNYAGRPYDDEQWDVMFFVQGRVEMILRDVREGLQVRVMRFYIDGDNYPTASNVGVVIPPGVAHALRVEGSEDAIMVYGTSTSFHPEFEGRIASEVETADLPPSWQRFLGPQ